MPSIFPHEVKIEIFQKEEGIDLQEICYIPCKLLYLARMLWQISCTSPKHTDKRKEPNSASHGTSTWSSSNSRWSSFIKHFVEKGRVGSCFLVKRLFLAFLFSFLEVG